MQDGWAERVEEDFINTVSETGVRLQSIASRGNEDER